MSRGQDHIERQLADMDAQGLGDRSGAVGLTKAPRPDVGPGPREPWRAVIGALLLLGGVALWFAGHLHTVPSDLAAQLEATNRRIALEIVGVGTALLGVVWLFRQVRPRRRTYDRREVVQAWTIGLFAVAGATLWTVAHLYADDVLGSVLLLVVVVLLQTDFVTRMTGPNGARRPAADDPRAAIWAALTPWPVMLGISVLFPAYQAYELLS